MGEVVTLSCCRHANRLCETLWRFQRDQYKTDVEVELSSGVHLPLHHLILSVFAPKFKDFTHTVLELDVREEDFNVLLQFIYLGKVEVEEEKLPRLRQGAELLGLDTLVKLIEQQSCKGGDSTKKKLSKPVRLNRRTSKELTDPEVIIHESKELCSSSEEDADSDSSSSKTVKRRRGQYKKHDVYDAERDEYVCQTCDKGYRNKDSYYSHIRCHEEKPSAPPTHKCQHCDYQTSVKTNWRTHLAAVHKMDPDGNVLQKNIKCPECHFTCVSMFQLKNHTYFKHTTKKYMCQQCGYSCMRKSEYEVHVRGKHGNERPYMCEQCGYRGKSPHHLKNHMRTHTGEKPFHCDVCGQSFAETGTLKCHKQTHDSSLERPFPCHLCQFASWRRHSLKVHYQHVHKVSFHHNEEFVSWLTQLRQQFQDKT